jgi:predicted signal transduction protein with EAL and GGDEF domain
VHGSASVGIALYPEDAATRDSLLSAADAAMYAAKNAKKQLAHILGTQREHALASKVRA